ELIGLVAQGDEARALGEVLEQREAGVPGVGVELDGGDRTLGSAEGSPQRGEERWSVALEQRAFAALEDVAEVRRHESALSRWRSTPCRRPCCRRAASPWRRRARPRPTPSCSCLRR